ncbi:hypothetical protein K7887_22145 (plasmid) [Sutcliffiella horikoshii]|uniref:DUF6161 domain-containing protein n=1 Tax=Sutcliffiella horikoshii TaxID=79883 RepID=UPI001CBEACB5|nr:DUF6161 domain-containing protein [Sutcliffiella horikoshii]UAL49823.1 hypothetical protein K7887_22145 [Sutcliffiella horikoshii]
MTATLEGTLLEQFKSKNVILTLYPEDIKKDFKGDFQYFYQFISEQVDFWSELKTGANCQKIHSHFTGVKKHLDTAINSQNNNHHNATISLNSAINLSLQRNWYNIYKETDLANFIIERYHISPDQAEAVIDYFLIRNGHKNLNSKEYFNGVLQSFIYEEQNNALKRKLHAPKQALLQLKETFSNDRDELYGAYKDKQNEVEELFSTLKMELNSWKDELVVTSEDFFQKKQEELNKLVADKNKELEQMEQLYREKLRLEGPATYWNDLHNFYNNRGDRWRKWALGISFIFSIVVIFMLYFTPSILFPNGTYTLNSIKAMVIFAVVSSIAIYLIRLFVLLSTSAYHLSRDAKERFQLTYVYLSLIQEKGVSEADRTIILQSLFSRADTGLLKGDSGPTVPDGTLSQLIKNMQSK